MLIFDIEAIADLQFVLLVFQHVMLVLSSFTGTQERNKRPNNALQLNADS